MRLPSRYLFLSLGFSLCVTLVVLAGLTVVSSPMSQRFSNTVVLAVSELLQYSDEKDLPKFIKAVSAFKLHFPRTQFELFLLDKDQRVLAGTGPTPVPFISTLGHLPEAAGKAQFYETSLLKFDSVTRLKNTSSPYWLWLHLDASTLSGGPVRTWLYTMGLIVLFAASISSYLLLLFAFRLKSRQAKRVIDSISNGNLEARLSVSKKDESAELSRSFNRMAERIETLVGNLKSSEEVRKKLVGELSHDLRTPVTAMRLAIDSMRDLPTAHSKEVDRFLQVASRELAYIQRLLEYLFTVAKSGEPLLQVKFESLDLISALKSEIDTYRVMELQRGSQVTWRVNAKLQSVLTSADRALLKRLFRNLLDNARKHATASVVIEVERDDDQVVISIFNDGKPIQTSSFHAPSRLNEVSVDDAVYAETSLGLGSKIIDAISKLHEWEVAIEPRSNGTVVFLRIPDATRELLAKAG